MIERALLKHSLQKAGVNLDKYAGVLIVSRTRVRYTR